MIRYTIRECGDGFGVFKMKPHSDTPATGGGYRPRVWFVSAAAKPQFVGGYSACYDWIVAAGGQYMSEHGLPV